MNNDKAKDENSSLEMLREIVSSMRSVDNKMHNKYTREDMEETLNEIKRCQAAAGEKCRELNIMSTENPNSDSYKEIGSLCTKLKNEFGKKDIEELQDRERDAFNEIFENLFGLYSNLNYSFQTAGKETKDDIWENKETRLDTWVISLCKNVRIMEDMIDKICSNNIDKSIIGGEKHFDSMRAGFEWLFCHNDNNRNASYKRIDIRDRNRYLDYIKYQIMVASKYVDSSPKSSMEIDEFYQHIKDTFDKKEFENKANLIKKFKADVVKLIEVFFSVYELLTKYRDLLFHEEEIRKEFTGDRGRDQQETDNTSVIINADILNLSFVAVRVLLDRFVSFVKINDLNFGNSTFNHSWFNYSELSNSNYTGSNFKYARLENAKVKACDISTCNLSLSDGGKTDFSNSNFNYSDLTGMNLIDAIVNYCEFQNAIFRDANIDSYQNAIGEIWGEDLAREERAGKLLAVWPQYPVPKKESLEDIADLYKNIEPPDLKIGEERNWRILKYEIPEKEKRKFAYVIRRVLQKFFEKHISAELLCLAKKRIFWRRSIKVFEKYGKVRLEIANLKGISAKYAQLGGSDLCHVCMSNASFENADMSGTVMHYAKADKVSFMFSNMNKAECFETDFYSSNFTNALLNEALFLNCRLNHTNFGKAILIGSVFADLSEYIEPTINQQNADSISIKINESFAFEPDPKGQRMIADCPKKDSIPDKNSSNAFWQSDCGVNDTSFIKTLADNVVFLNIEANRSTFDGSSFKNSVFANCSMCLSDFIETDFRYSNIVLCCMGQSNFTNANMTNSVLRYVDFTNSNLSGVLMNLCEVNHALFENAGLSSVNFSGTQISNSAFINSKMNHMVMSEAKFKNCIFAHIHFSDMIGFRSAIMENCYFCHCVYEDGKTKELKNGILTIEDIFNLENE